MSSSMYRYVRAGLLAVAIAGCAQASPSAGSPDASPAADAQVELDAFVHLDAPPPPPDAPPPPPDAPPPGCTVMQRNLLVNGNFDASPLGTGWVETPADPTLPLITPDGTVVHTPPNKAWLGGLESAFDFLTQDVVVPPSTSVLVLTGYYQVRTNELFNFLAYDTASVELTTTNGAVIQSVLKVDNRDSSTSWQQISFAFTTPHAGETVRVRLSSLNDSSNVTSFFFDSMALTATVCE